MITGRSAELTVQGETDSLQRVRLFVEEVIAASDLDLALRNRIVVAIDEAVTNIIKHALDEQRRDPIEIRIAVSSVRIEVLIRDSGCSFNPKEIREPDLAEMVREGRRGGLGIFLMRRIMDEVEYIFEEGVRNELRMVKYL